MDRATWRMTGPQTSFLDKVLGRIGRLDPEGLQTVVERLARERRFLETLFNTIEDGLLVVDETGRVLYFNHAVTQLLGLQPQQAEGQKVTRFLPQLDWSDLVSLDRRGGAGVLRQEFEVTYPRQRFLRLYAAPLDGEAARSSGLALILHDATEARLKTAEAIETERLQALTLLAASVAHEIGNPLNALHIHLQLMERELRKLRAVSARPVAAPGKVFRRGRQAATPPDDAPAREEGLEKLDKYLAVAKGEISRLDYIITQFLQAIRPSPPRKQSVDLNAVVEDTLRLLGPELENRGHAVETRLYTKLPEAPLDPVQIKQVLVNLIKNAMQAMTRGGVLTLETGASADGVWVSLADTGSGISQEQLSRIFKPFYTTKRRGSGLGLMIVQRVMRDHGGLIKLDSHAGRGTTFRLWFPLFEPQPRLLESQAHD
jgi:two-component system, sporulation sensor kinase E